VGRPPPPHELPRLYHRTLFPDIRKPPQVGVAPHSDQRLALDGRYMMEWEARFKDGESPSRGVCFPKLDSTLSRPAGRLTVSEP
jgi:hypothetical protein